MEPKHFEQLYPEKTRFNEIKSMLEIIKSGRSAQIVGLPGVGKSNVLRLLPYNKEVRILHLGADESKYHFVYMDFSEVKERNLYDIVKFILISLSYSLGERGFTEEQTFVNNTLKESLEFQDELIFFQSLKRSVDYLSNERSLHVIFLFDRFDEYIPNIDQRFFLNMKILRNRVKYNFAGVFSSTLPLEETLEPSVFAEFYEFIIGNIVYVSIHDEIGLEFRLKHLEEVTGKKADKKIKEEMVKLTGGHGKLSRVSYESILGESPTNDLKEFLSSKNQVRGALREIWRALTPEEKQDVRDNEKNEYLEKTGLTVNAKLTIPLLSPLVDDAESDPKAPLKYNAERNEITKGNENLTEKLSPSEFRLLRYLLTNPGKVCEKDEIIENVWRDSQTQEGVTDQALDQIIYRLRKKIEADPNNPQFIQTIKGRGYRLSE